MMLKSAEIKNWKLKEVANYVEIVASDSIQYRDELLAILQLPQTGAGMYKSDTCIDWMGMSEYYKFFFDIEGWEERIKGYFERSALSKTEKLIVTYGWKEPMVKIPTQLFLDDWGGFIASTVWETIIFSEDYRLIMEVSRDYYLHSNFKIKDD